MNNTATTALASQITPSDEQGGLFGVIQAMQGVGRIIGPLLGSLLRPLRLQGALLGGHRIWPWASAGCTV